MQSELQVLWMKAEDLPLKKMFESLVNLKARLDVPLVQTLQFPDINKCTKVKEDALYSLKKY